MTSDLRVGRVLTHCCRSRTAALAQANGSGRAAPRLLRSNGSASSRVLLDELPHRAASFLQLVRLSVYQLVVEGFRAVPSAP
jgi:hypothetical protein